MLNTEDIKNLADFLTEVFKDIFATKDDMNNLSAKIDRVQNSVDSFAKNDKSNTDELKVYGHRVDRLEKWAKNTGNKVGMKFET